MEYHISIHPIPKKATRRNATTSPISLTDGLPDRKLTTLGLSSHHQTEPECTSTRIIERQTETSSLLPHFPQPFGTILHSQAPPQYPPTNPSIHPTPFHNNERKTKTTHNSLNQSAIRALALHRQGSKPTLTPQRSLRIINQLPPTGTSAPIGYFIPCHAKSISFVQLDCTWHFATVEKQVQG